MDVRFFVCDACNTNINLSGFWELFVTENGVEEEDTEYWCLKQTGETISGFWWDCGEDKALTGSVDGNYVYLEFPESSVGPVAIDGTYSFNEISGAFDNITWRAVKKGGEPECIMEVNVSTQNYENDSYYLGITLSGIDFSTIDAVDVTGPNINSVWKSSEDHYVANLSSEPVLGASYMIHEP